jgi:hypothetical protein
MHVRSPLILMVVLLLFTVACNRRDSTTEEWRAGGLYSVANGNGKFGVVKILVLETDAVHVRIYKQTFLMRPTAIDPKSLTLGPFDDKEGFSIGHLPLSRRTFESWDPVFLSQESVSDNELDGYKMWKDAPGKTF